MYRSSIRLKVKKKINAKNDEIRTKHIKGSSQSLTSLKYLLMNFISKFTLEVSQAYCRLLQQQKRYDVLNTGNQFTY